MFVDDAGELLVNAVILLVSRWRGALSVKPGFWADGVVPLPGQLTAALVLQMLDGKYVCPTHANLSKIAELTRSQIQVALWAMASQFTRYEASWFCVAPYKHSNAGQHTLGAGLQVFGRAAAQLPAVPLRTQTAGEPDAIVLHDRQHAELSAAHRGRRRPNGAPSADCDEFHQLIGDQTPPTRDHPPPLPRADCRRSAEVSQ
jgi:hypothetical protein